MQIAIITGEASGDRTGAQLAREIRRIAPEAKLWGTGGKYLREVGVEILVDSARWGVIGIASGLRLLPQVLAGANHLKSELLKRKPDVIVPVDAGAFNIGFAGLEGLCPWIRRHLPQTRILYYFPPGSWRRTLKGTPLINLADRVATPFPWSETELRRLGVEATFVGHPLLDIVKPTLSPEAFADKYGIDREHPVVGILPGSRPAEIEQILPVQLAAASIIHQRVAGVQFLIALAPTIDRSEVESKIEQERAESHKREDAARQLAEREKEGLISEGAIPIPVGGQESVSPGDIARRRKEWLQRAADMPPSHGDISVAIVEDATYDVMSASDVLLTTSGTATLEAAILGKPMVITYRMSSVNRWEYFFVRKSLPEHIGMPNILAQREICPEFIQEEATPQALANEIIDLLLEPERLLKMRSALKEATQLLGQPGGAERTAQMVVELARQGKR